LKLLAVVKTRKLEYFGHTSRHALLDKDILLRTMPGLRRQGSVKNERSTSPNDRNTGLRPVAARQVVTSFIVYRVTHAGGTAP